MLKRRPIVNILTCIFFLTPIFLCISGLVIVPILALITSLILYRNYKRISWHKLLNYKILHYMIGILFLSSLLNEDYSVAFSEVGKILIMIFAWLILFNARIATDNAKRYFAATIYGLTIAIISLTLLQLNEGRIIHNIFASQDIFFDNIEFITLMINRSLSLFVLLGATAIYFLYKNKRFIASSSLLIAMIIMIGISDSGTAKLTLISTILIFITSYILKNKTRIILPIYLTANLCAILIFSTLNIQNISNQNNLGYSSLHRLCIWQYTAQESIQTPWGHGFNSSRNKQYNHTLDKDICIYNAQNITGEVEDIYYHIPLHPHYNILQIMFELGFVGLLAFIYMLHYISRHIERYDRIPKSLLYSLLYGYLTISSTGYGIWQSWYFASSVFILLLTKLLFIATKTAQSK